MNEDVIRPLNDLVVKTRPGSETDPVDRHQWSMARPGLLP